MQDKGKKNRERHKVSVERDKWSEQENREIRRKRKRGRHSLCICRESLNMTRLPSPPPPPLNSEFIFSFFSACLSLQWPPVLMFEDKPDWLKRKKIFRQDNKRISLWEKQLRENFFIARQKCRKSPTFLVPEFVVVEIHFYHRIKWRFNTISTRRQCFWTVESRC